MSGRAEVQAGVCGHGTSIVAESGGARTVTFSLETTCENIERLAAALEAHGSVDAFAEIDPKGESAVLRLRREARCCTDCVVPVSAIKALRLATGLALPGDVAIALAKD